MAVVVVLRAQWRGRQAQELGIALKCEPAGVEKPKERRRGRPLVELGSSDRTNPAGPAPHAELFLRAGGAVQSARGIAQRLKNTTSVLARALLSAEIAAALREVREALKSIQQARDELAKCLQDVDSRWPEVSASELAALASSFKFLARWTAELSEWEFRLSNG